MPGKKRAAQPDSGARLVKKRAPGPKGAAPSLESVRADAEDQVHVFLEGVSQQQAQALAALDEEEARMRERAQAGLERVLGLVRSSQEVVEVLGRKHRKRASQLRAVEAAGAAAMGEALAAVKGCLDAVQEANASGLGDLRAQYKLA